MYIDSQIIKLILQKINFIKHFYTIAAILYYFVNRN